MGRPSLGNSPMTAAERKARSRANTLGELVAHLDQAQTVVAGLSAAVKGSWKLKGTYEGMVSSDALEGVVERLEEHLALALAAVPKS
jgi:hypothetical protein